MPPACIVRWCAFDPPGPRCHCLRAGPLLSLKVPKPQPLVDCLCASTPYPTCLSVCHAPPVLQQIIFDYTAYNEAGATIDSSYRKGQPAQTQLGIKGLIPGGNTGLCVVVWCGWGQAGRGMWCVGRGGVLECGWRRRVSTANSAFELAAGHAVAPSSCAAFLLMLTPAPLYTVPVHAACRI